MINNQHYLSHIELREMSDYYKTGKNKGTQYFEEMFFCSHSLFSSLVITTSILFSVCFQYLFFNRKQLKILFWFTVSCTIILNSVFLVQFCKNKTQTLVIKSETLTFSKVNNYIYIYIYVYICIYMYIYVCI